MPTSASNRAYSGPPSIHNVTMEHLWDPDLVINGGTGNWRPVEQSDFTNITLSGVNIDVGITGGVYTSSMSNITGSQVIVPTGRKSVSVAVESGTAYINGMAINAGVTLNLGGYDGRFTSSVAYAIGITGGRAYVVYE